MAAALRSTRGAGNPLLSTLLRRLAQAAVVLLLVSMVAFALVLLTGDPVAMMMPIHASEADRRVLEQQLGLDRPYVVQYLDFLAGIARGELGQSIKFNQPVGHVKKGSRRGREAAQRSAKRGITSRPSAWMAASGSGPSGGPKLR